MMRVASTKARKAQAVANITGQGKAATMTPAEVAMPFPPENPSQMHQLWPSLATSTATTPLDMSRMSTPRKGWKP